MNVEAEIVWNAELQRRQDAHMVEVRRLLATLVMYSATVRSRWSTLRLRMWSRHSLRRLPR